MSKTLYFAFGSNMLRERLLVPDRCSVAVSLGPAVAHGYRVTMWKRSSRDGSGKATLMEAEGHVAHGVLYELQSDEIPLLDKSEGVGFGYEREEEFPVIWQSRSVAAHTYVAPPPYVDETLLAFDWYSALVVAGAQQHGLPSDYVDALQAMPTLPDPQPDREARQWALTLLREAGFADLADRCEG